MPGGGEADLSVFNHESLLSSGDHSEERQHITKFVKPVWKAIEVIIYLFFPTVQCFIFLVNNSFKSPVSGINTVANGNQHECAGTLVFHQ